MMKRTEGITLLASLIAAGGLCCGATRAHAASIAVGSATGAAGSTVTVSVTLSSEGSMVAGVAADITFDPANAPIATSTAGNCAVTTTQTCNADTDCPDLMTPFTGKEPCVNKNAPDCDVTAAGKGGFFAFEPSMCAGAACTSVRAFILSLTNLTAIADGPLFSCKVAIPAGAAMADYPLTVSNLGMADTAFQTIANPTSTNGKVTVGVPTGFEVCDVAPSTGSDAGQFGNGSLNIADVKAVFKAAQFGGSFLPPAGSALFSAMDAVTVDAPPTCGGNGSINIADVKKCFQRSQFPTQNPTFTRTVPGAGCVSAPK